MSTTIPKPGTTEWQSDIKKYVTNTIFRNSYVLSTSQNYKSTIETIEHLYSPYRLQLEQFQAKPNKTQQDLQAIKIIKCSIDGFELIKTSLNSASPNLDEFRNLLLTLDNYRLQLIAENVFINPELRIIWENAFTHQSVDLNNNYEVIEKIGDRVLKLAFTEYLRKSDPKLNQADIARYEIYYTAKDYLANIVEPRFGLDPYIWTTIGITKDIKEDMVESIIGALFQTIDKVTGPGSGYVAAFNLVSSIWQDVKLDPEILKGDPKSQVKELFEKLGFPPKKYPFKTFTELPSSNYQYTIYVDNKVLNLFRRNRKNLPKDMVLGVGVGPNKRAAEKDAYIKALKLFNNAKITAKWADNISLKDLLYTNNLSDIWKAAEEKLKLSGFSSLTFSKLEIGEDLNRYIMIIGIKEDGSKEILNKVKGPAKTNSKDMKIRALKRYVGVQ